jgi:hypothetical protein
MKHRHCIVKLTFGDLIAGLYGACDRRRAEALVRFAVNAGLLRIPHLRDCWRNRTHSAATPAPVATERPRLVASVH